MSLVDFLDQLEAADEEMQKEASEYEKLAAEEEAAGRIMARGFMDELDKLAQRMPGQSLPPAASHTMKPMPAPKPAKLPEMKVKQALPGSKIYKQQMALAKKQPKVKSLGATERAQYRSRSEAIRAMQREQEGGGMSSARAKYWSNIMKGF